MSIPQLPIDTIEKVVSPYMTEDGRIGLAHLRFGGEELEALDVLLATASANRVPLPEGSLRAVLAVLAGLTSENGKLLAEEMRHAIGAIPRAA